MQRFIMDLDGTLMPSHEVDNRCYWQAVEEVFEIETGLPELRNFRHITDFGILEEWANLQLGRIPTGDEIRSVRQVFLTRLERNAQQNPAHFEPLPGVRQWLSGQSEHGQRQLAIATGGWRHTAEFKLRTSGLAQFDIPLASADDAVRRTDIMRCALHMLVAPDDIAPTPTYIGDGPWDYQASRDLGWEFLGIASGTRARHLREAGASHVYPDFEALAADQR